MNKIVPSRPVLEDPVNYLSKRRKALRLILAGTFLIICGVVMFIVTPQLKPEEGSSAALAIATIAIGFLGTTLFIWGLNILPKVKMPPDNIIR